MTIYSSYNEEENTMKNNPIRDFLEEAKKVEDALTIKGKARSETIIDIEDATDPSSIFPRLLSRTVNGTNGTISTLKRTYNDRGDLMFESYETDSETEKSYEKNISYNYGTNFNYKETIINEIGGLILEEETIQRDIYPVDNGKKETVIEKYYHRYGYEKDDGNFQDINMIENLYDDNHNLIMKKDVKGASEIYEYDDKNRLVYQAEFQNNIIIKEQHITFSDDGTRTIKVRYYVNGKLSHMHEYIHDDLNHNNEHLYYGNIQNGVFTSHRHYVVVYDDNDDLIYMSDISDDERYIIRRVTCGDEYIWYTTKNGKLIKYEKEFEDDYVKMHLSCELHDGDIEIYLEKTLTQNEFELIPTKIALHYRGSVSASEIGLKEISFDNVFKYVMPSGYHSKITDESGVDISTIHVDVYTSICKTYPVNGNERRVEKFMKYPIPSNKKDLNHELSAAVNGSVKNIM